MGYQFHESMKGVCGLGILSVRGGAACLSAWITGLKTILATKNTKRHKDEALAKLRFARAGVSSK
jgi:hypothetical protein